MRTRLRGLRTHMLNILVVGLLAASVFFTIEVERRREALQATQEGDFKAGDEVLVVAVIDGDEVSVTDGQGRRTLVRLVGLRAFAPAVNDPTVGTHGQRAFDHLTGLIGQKVKVFPGDPARDSRQRLLAHLETTADPPVDVARQMISDGLGVAYTEYPHTREVDYLAAEVEAARARRGVWADEALVERIQAQKQAWNERRSRRQ